MYIRLSDKAVLRGWLDIPRTIVIREKVSAKKPHENLRIRWRMGHCPLPFVKEEYDFVKKLDGQTEFDNLNEMQQRVFNRLKEQELLIVSDKPLPPLDPNQFYMGYRTIHLNSCKWSVTGRCNYKCRHCIVSAPKGIHPQLNLEQCKLLIRQMYDCGVYNVLLTGGEPLLRPDFTGIIDLLTEYGISIHDIYTNGSLVTEELLDYIEKRGHHPEFLVSFDGTDGCHDMLRGVPGAEAKALQAIKLLKKKGYLVTVTMCVHKKNAHVIRNTAKLMGELGVDEFDITPTQEIGLWKNEAADLGLSPEEIMNVALSYIPQYFEDGMPVNLKLFGIFYCPKHKSGYIIGDTNLYNDIDELKKSYICPTARNSAYISPEGQLMPCMSYASADFADKFPSLFEIPLSQALTDSLASRIMCEKLERYLERNEKCRDCSKLLICGGGCRASGLAGEGADHLCIDEITCYFHLNNWAEKSQEVADQTIERLGLK